VPITPFLYNQAFEPEALENISAAFAEARNALGLRDRDDKLTELVARRMIELAQQCVRTKTALYLLTVKEFRGEPQ
jgi:hypothetical protein